jgi:hypothetical protein
MDDDNNLVVLSNDDKLVPSSAIYARLMKYSVPCLRVADARHADIFINKEYKNVLTTIINYIAIDSRINK